MKSIPIIIVFCVVITLTSTKKLNTLCPEKEVIKNFQIENYFGKWFVINRYDDSQTKRTPKCIVSEYFRDDSDNGTIKTRLTFLDDSNVWQTSESNFIKPSDGEIVPNYNILETDYKNYSIVWKCRNTGENQSEEATWVLSRNLTVSDDVRSIIDAAIERHLEREALLIVNQDKELCGY